MKRRFLKSIGLAVTAALAAAQIPGTWPVAVVNDPGFAVAFSLFFAADDTRATKFLSWLTYVGVNACCWLLVVLMVGFVWTRRSESVDPPLKT